ncbi:MAG: D-2-hydroxyacid dehydrogenase [Bacteroidetes bacterium]|nr:D-2-hydroxyacid dehydrogenase [Bacteroidota bacterium]
MARILANDGISEAGKAIIENAGHEVVTEKIEQADLLSQLNNFDGIIVRSATTVRKDLIDACPNLKFIGRAGVGLDNIDVAYAKEKGKHVANTPAASSESVAELAIAHMFAAYRFLHESNRDMPAKGQTEFNALKKAYSKGKELSGKTLGIIGGGRIGIETMKRAIGLGMKVVYFDPNLNEISFLLDLHPSMTSNKVEIKLTAVSLDELLASSDIISLHVPNIGRYILAEEEFAKMKDGVVLINCARGGTVKEEAMLNALNAGKVAAVGVDVFENEPTNNITLLQHSKASLTPHIGGSTIEAQDRIGTQMADQVVEFFK